MAATGPIPGPTLGREGRPAGRRIRGLDAEQRRSQRREQLLDGALETIAADGYLNTSIEQICQAAYVGTKGFYEIFDSKEACYIALLARIAERTGDVITTALSDAPSDERSAIPMLLGAFAHALVDDPRVARVTFGEASGVSRAIERQRRANRRWAAGFVELIWGHYEPITGPAGGLPASRRPDRHAMAIGVIGGMFDLIADWLLDADPARTADSEDLIAELTDFFQVVHDGLRTKPPVD